MTRSPGFDCSLLISDRFSRPRIAAVLCCATTLATISLLASCGGGSVTSTTVVPPPNTDVSITFTSSTLPAAFAEKIGTAAWSSVAVPSNGQFSISIPSGTTDFAFAYNCSLGASGTPQNFEYVFEAATADGTSYNRTCPYAINTVQETRTADASAVPGAVNLKVFGGFPGGALVPGISAPFQISLATGTSDLAVGAVDSQNNLLGVKIVRNQTVPGVVNGGNTITLAATDETTVQPITVSNTPSGFDLNVLAYYETPNRGIIQVSGSSPNQYVSVPASEAQSGDSYFFSVSASQVRQSVLTLLTQSAAGAVTIQLPSPMAYVAPTPAPFPTFSLNYTGFPGSAGVIDVAVMVWANSSGLYTSSLAATENYLNGGTSITFPDLTSIAGFPGPAASGASVNWTAYVSSGSSSSGTESQAATFGNFTEP